MEQAIVSGVTYALDDAKVTIHGVPDRPAWPPTSSPPWPRPTSTWT